MLCILIKVPVPSSSHKQENKEDLKHFALISSSIFRVPRNLTKSTAISIGRDSGAQSENKQNTCRRTASLSKALVIAILTAEVVVLEYAVFSFARTFSVASRPPWESLSK